MASQDKLGLELDSLIEDAQNASVRVIAAEAYAKLTSGAAGPQSAEETERSTWISPAPATVKMRLFCLPYAGGISENVYSRYCNFHLKPYLIPLSYPVSPSSSGVKACRSSADHGPEACSREGQRRVDE